jgi:hypothetical protein
MSMTPTTPNFSLKSFWKRPEGKTGTAVLLVSTLALVYGGVVFLPVIFAAVASILQSLFLSALSIVGLITLLYVVTNKTFRNIVSNVFQLSMRWITGVVVELDPIGILRNNLDRMRSKNEELGRGVAGCRGAKTQLERQIATNTESITHARSLIAEVDRKTGLTTDNLVRQSLILRKQAQLQEIGRKMHSNETLDGILKQTTRMYTLLTRWQQLAEFNIENTQAEVDNLAVERKTILASYKALGPAQRLIKGDPEQLKMVNRSLEYLAEDNANKLGAMEDFARYSQKFLDGMDLEQGASASDAEKMLGEFEKRLLSAGSSESVSLQRPVDAEAVPVPRGGSRTTPVEGDYIDWK